MEDLIEQDSTGPYYSRVIDFIHGFLPEVLQAIIILLVGFWLINKIISPLSTLVQRLDMSTESKSLLVSSIDILLKVILFLIVASLFGFNTASFVAVLLAIGFVIGMALQGSLGNFAAGIIVLLFKPYKVEDWIELDGKFGKVSEIHIFYTNVITPGNKKLIIPNGEMINGIVTNYSEGDHIRIEQEVMIPYSEDFPKVRDIILQVLKNIDKVLNDPTPEVGILRFDTQSVVVSVRPYVLADDYWEVYYESYAKIKEAFHEHNIGFAYKDGTVGKIGK
jgi:small conductance mechanosensitive channel